MKTIEIFEAGDVVVLKSGSPKMTVAAKDKKTGLILCEWFSPDYTHVLSNDFNPSELTIYK